MNRLRIFLTAWFGILVVASMTVGSETYGFIPAHYPFEAVVTSIPPSVASHMKKSTWRPECPIPLSALDYIQISYWGFDDRPHTGVLIVNKTIASQVVGIFKSLYEHRFPIRRMLPMYYFQGDDEQAMDNNNTSAFNCKKPSGEDKTYSLHAYGLAIDINAKINPYVKGKTVLPLAATAYVDRNQPAKGKITKNSIVYKLFIKAGWIWGGDWRNVKEYRHFEKKQKSKQLALA